MSKKSLVSRVSFTRLLPFAASVRSMVEMPKYLFMARRKGPRNSTTRGQSQKHCRRLDERSRSGARSVRINGAYANIRPLHHRPDPPAFNPAVYKLRNHVESNLSPSHSANCPSIVGNTCCRPHAWHNVLMRTGLNRASAPSLRAAKARSVGSCPDT